MVGLVPLSANLGYNVAIVTYNQMVTFGMLAEPRLMPDVELMQAFAAEVFIELMGAANHAAEARTSGTGGSADKASHAA
jgi:hypothetical protein